MEEIIANKLQEQLDTLDKFLCEYYHQIRGKVLDKDIFFTLHSSVIEAKKFLTQKKLQKNLVE